LKHAHCSGVGKEVILELGEKSLLFLLDDVFSMFIIDMKFDKFRTFKELHAIRAGKFAFRLLNNYTLKERFKMPMCNRVSLLVKLHPANSSRRCQSCIRGGEEGGDGLIEFLYPLLGTLCAFGLPEVSLSTCCK
jgi:hypothetical protein